MTPRARTLAETRDLLEQNVKNWPAASRRQMLNALDRLSRLTGTPLAELPAEETALAALIDGALGWRAAGFKSPAAFRDFKGRVARAARETGGPALLRFTPRDQWLPPWRALLDDLEAAIARGEEKPWARRAIAHLAGYANASGLTPEQVDSEVLAELLAAHARNKGLADTAGLRAVDYARKAIDSARAWNRLVAQKNGKPWLRRLPATVLAWEGRRQQVNPPLTAYPASFQADVTAYLASLAQSDGPVVPDDPDDPLGAIPPELASFEAWEATQGEAVTLTDVRAPQATPADPGKTRRKDVFRPATIANHRFWILQTAGAVVRRELLAIEQLRSLRDICTYPAVHAAVNDYIQRQHGKSDGEHRTRAASASTLLETMCAVAERWCGAPDGYVHAMRKKLRPGVRTESRGSMSAGRRAMLAQFDEPWALITWFDHPLTLFKRAEDRRKAGQRIRPRDIGDVEVALLCRVLGVLPVRRRNVATLRVRGARRSLQLKRHAGEKSWIFWQPDEVKNNRYLRAELDRDTERMIRVYLAHWRPAYLALNPETPDSDFLFPGRVGDGHRAPGNLGANMTDRMAEAGLKMTLHLARHLAAKIMVDADPRLVGTAAELLGISESTARRFYLDNRSIQASRTLREIVRKRRPQIEREWIAAHRP